MSNPLKGIGKVFKKVAQTAIKIAPFAMLAIGVGFATGAIPAMAANMGLVNSSLAQTGVATSAAGAAGAAGAGPPTVSSMLAAGDIAGGTLVTETLAGPALASPVAGATPAATALTPAGAGAPIGFGGTAMRGSIAGPALSSPASVQSPFAEALQRGMTSNIGPLSEEAQTGVTPPGQAASAQAGASPNVMGTTPAGVGPASPEAAVSPYVKTGMPESMGVGMPAAGVGAPSSTATSVMSPGVMGTTQGGGALGWVERHPTTTLLGSQFLLGGLSNMGDTEAEIIAAQREKERERAERNLNVASINLPGIYHVRPGRI